MGIAFLLVDLSWEVMFHATVIRLTVVAGQQNVYVGPPIIRLTYIDCYNLTNVFENGISDR